MFMNKEINDFVKKLQERKLTLAIAESVTCGMAAQKLATCKGTSEVLAGSIVCYSEEAKINLMNIPKNIIDKFSCESMEVTEKLAANLTKLIKADIHAAVTGLASAGGSEKKGKPVGTVFLCVRFRGKTTKEKKIFRGAPMQVRLKACMAMYKLILRSLVSK